MQNGFSYYLGCLGWNCVCFALEADSLMLCKANPIGMKHIIAVFNHYSKCSDLETDRNKPNIVTVEVAKDVVM